MKFEYEGKLYKLTFQHLTKQTKRILQRWTAAQLLTWLVEGEVEGWHEVSSGETRCRSGKKGDQYTREEGRRWALKALGEKLDPGLKGAMLHAYFNRPHLPDPFSLRLMIAKLESLLKFVEGKDYKPVL